MQETAQVCAQGCVNHKRPIGSAVRSTVVPKSEMLIELGPLPHSEKLSSRGRGGVKRCP